MPRTDFTDAQSLITYALECDYFVGDNPAIPSLFVPGEGNVVVITGENAGGKSFLRRILLQIAKMNKVDPMHISMEGRRRIGESPWLAMVYGDEETQATGVNSVGTVVQGMNTVKTRTDPHIVIWDEPDIGASDSTAASMGAALCKCFAEPLPHTLACVIITHRKALVEQLLPLKPHYCYLGSSCPPRTIQEWIAKPVEVRDLDEIRQDSRTRYKAIQALIPKNSR